MTEAGRPGGATRPKAEVPTPSGPGGRRPSLSRPSLPRVPAHVGVLLGVSAGTYGVLLAGTTALQATAESAVAADKAPVVDALTQLVAGHDRLQARLDEARERYGEASVAYDGLVTQIAAYEQRIEELTGRIDRLQAETGQLPTTVAGPTPAPVSAPVRTTTSTSTTTTTVALAPLATPAPKPVATAVTGASVKK